MRSRSSPSSEPSSAQSPTIVFDARFINDRYHGIGRHAYNLLEALTRLDPARRYVVVYHPQYQNTRFDLAGLGCRGNVELLPTRLRLYTPSEQVVWPWLLHKFRASIFHSPYVTLPLLSPAPLIMTVHDLIYERFPEYRPRGWLGSLYPLQTTLALWRAAAVLTISEATRVDLTAHYKVKASKIRVIGAGVDQTFRRETDVARLAEVRKRYELPERFVLTLAAGRPHKNLAMVVEALANVDLEKPPSLVIAGAEDSRFSDQVAQATRKLGLEQRVLRVGPVQEGDLAALYTLADAFVFPSLVEGFGLPPVEAMACGTPVLAASAPGVSEAVGDGALSFNPFDHRELGALLSRLLTDPVLQASTSQRGLQRVRALRWDNVARETLSVYDLVSRRIQVSRSAGG